MKDRHEWCREAADEYTRGNTPLGVLAHMTGVDTIDAAGGLAAEGFKVKVTPGRKEDRARVVKDVIELNKAGCVLDLLTFWTAWRLKMLPIVTDLCGQVYVPQSVVDRLRRRRERFQNFGQEPHRSAGYRNGKIVLQEVAAADIEAIRSDIDDAILWINANAVVSPATLTDNIAPTLRASLGKANSDIFHGLIVALNHELAYITDDGVLRNAFLQVSESCKAGWLHILAGIGLDRGLIAPREYIKLTVSLIEFGHDYLGIGAWALSLAVRMDLEDGVFPGPHFSTLSCAIGGAGAEPNSHLTTVLEFISTIWRDKYFLSVRQQATSIILSRLISERGSDFDKILRSAIYLKRDEPNVANYIIRWCKGHFVWLPVIEPLARIASAGARQAN